MNESIRDVIRNNLLTEASPRDAKIIAKKIAQRFGGTVAGSSVGWGTDITGIAKNKANQVIVHLKGEDFEDVSKDPVYRQLVSHLGPKAWVLTNDNGITVRIADVNKITDHTGKTVDKVDLMVNVLFD